MLDAYVFTNVATGETFTAPVSDILDQIFAAKPANLVMGKTQIEEPKKTRISHKDHSIIQMDMDGKVIAEFPTQKAALEAIGKDPKKSSMISDAVNGKTKDGVAYGYKWALKNPNA